MARDLLAQRAGRRRRGACSSTFALGDAFGADAGRTSWASCSPAAAVFGVVFGIIRGNDAGWGSLAGARPARRRRGAVSWPSCSGSGVRTRSCRSRLFRDRSFSAANGVGCFSIGIFGAIFILIQFLQVVQGKSPLEAGVMTMPWTMAPLMASRPSPASCAARGTRVAHRGGTTAAGRPASRGSRW